MAGVRYVGASRVYAKGAKPAVDMLDLDIKDGEFMVLVGPSGSGKTTALRMLAGLEPLDGGRIEIAGRDVSDVQPKDRDIAMVFQNYALYPSKTVAENMGFALKMQHVPRPERDRRVREAARILDLDEALLDRKPKALSGGQRQRVAMGRAIVREPKVFLMDEPLSNLDAKLRVQTRSQIAELQRRLGVTTVYVTHDQVEAMTMGHRVAVLSGGKLQQCASPRELYDNPVNQFVAGFIGSPAMNLLTAPLTEGGARLAGTVIPLGPAVRVAAERDRLTEIVLGIRPEQMHLVDAAGRSGRPEVGRGVGCGRPAASWVRRRRAGQRGAGRRRRAGGGARRGRAAARPAGRRRRLGGGQGRGPPAAGAGPAGRVPASSRPTSSPSTRPPAPGWRAEPSSLLRRSSDLPISIRLMEDPCGPSCSTVPAASGWQRYQIPRQDQARSSSRWTPAGSAAPTCTSWTASSRRRRTRSRPATSSRGRSRPSAPTSRWTCRRARRWRSTRRSTAGTAGAAGPAAATCARTGRPSATPSTARSPSTWRSPRPTRTGCPAGFDGQAAAMVEPLACAVHGLRRLGPVFGDSVVLTGAGTMGLLLLQLLVHAGAGPVTVVDRVPDRLEVASKLGAARVVGDIGELAGERFEIAVDATGVPAVLQAVSDLLDRGGRLLVFGVSPAEAALSVSPFRVYNDEITVTGSMAILLSFAPAVELITSGAVDPRLLLSKPLPLERVRRGAAPGAGRPGHQVAHPPVGLTRRAGVGGRFLG